MAKHTCTLYLIALTFLGKHRASLQPESPGPVIVAVESLWDRSTEHAAQPLRVEYPFNWFLIDYDEGQSSLCAVQEPGAEDSDDVCCVSDSSEASVIEVSQEECSVSPQVLGGGCGDVADVKSVCKVCEQQFSSQSSMNKHRRTQHPEVPLPVRLRPYRCTIAGCNKGYGKKNDLTKHLREKHRERRPIEYECKVCRTLFRNQSKLYRHKIKDHGKVFLCEVCGLTQRNQFELNAHRREAHPEPVTFTSEGGSDAGEIGEVEKQYKCVDKGCNKSYRWPSGLWLHRRTQHSKKTGTAESIEKDDAPQSQELCGSDTTSVWNNDPASDIDSNSSSGVEYTCGLCGVVCFSGTTMLMHMTISHSGGTM